MTVGNSGYTESIQDEEEGTKNRFLRYTEQDIIRSGSLGADAHFMQPTREEWSYPKYRAAMLNWCWRICRRMAWSTQSRAVLKSRSSRAVMKPAKSASTISLYTLTTAVSVEWSLRKPDCIGGVSCVTLRGLRFVCGWYARRGSRRMRDWISVGSWLGQRGRDLVFFVSRTNDGTFVSFKKFLISVIYRWAWRELEQKSSWYQWYVDEYGENWSKRVRDISDMSMNMARIGAKAWSSPVHTISRSSQRAAFQHFLV